MIAQLTIDYSVYLDVYKTGNIMTGSRSGVNGRSHGQSTGVWSRLRGILDLELLQVQDEKYHKER